MRESVADLEKLLVTLQNELNHDRAFFSGLLDHKNATMGWFRERQREHVAGLEAVYEATLNRQREDIAAVFKMYEDIVDTLMGEVKILEAHLATYEKGTPNAKD